MTGSSACASYLEAATTYFRSAVGILASGYHTSASTPLNVALQRVKQGLPHFTLHDLRRTARTHLAALGIRREVAERCLGHKLRGVEGTYDRYDYFEERRSALGQWTQVLEDAERGIRKVTPIRRAARRTIDSK